MIHALGELLEALIDDVRVDTDMSDANGTGADLQALTRGIDRVVSVADDPHNVRVVLRKARDVHGAVGNRDAALINRYRLCHLCVPSSSAFFVRRAIDQGRFNPVV